uniref:Uncharacterized protein n=1 Tax=Plectus sambesii TaxID=2011161 RepID=A0A914XP64_9BILA
MSTDKADGARMLSFDSDNKESSRADVEDTEETTEESPQTRIRSPPPKAPRRAPRKPQSRLPPTAANPPTAQPTYLELLAAGRLPPFFLPPYFRGDMTRQREREKCNARGEEKRRGEEGMGGGVPRRWTTLNLRRRLRVCVHADGPSGMHNAS